MKPKDPRQIIKELLADKDNLTEEKLMDVMAEQWAMGVMAEKMGLLDKRTDKYSHLKHFLLIMRCFAVWIFASTGAQELLVKAVPDASPAAKLVVGLYATFCLYFIFPWRYFFTTKL